MAPAIRFDPALVTLALVVAAAAALAPPAFRGAVIGIAIALLVLAAMPRGTRRLMFAVMIGLATGVAPLSLFAIGLFQLPITHEFGWSQATYSLVTPISQIVAVVCSLVIGRLFDRQGVRPFALGCTLLLGLLLISLYWLTPSPWHLYAIFAVVPVLGAGTSSIAYARVAARWFSARRGQALGAALAGIGIGGAVLSPLAQFLIGRVGWRGAYVGLGLLMICVTLPILWLWLHDAPEDVGIGVDGGPRVGTATQAGQGEVAGDAVSSSPIGLSAPQTRRLPRFWKMLFAFLVLAFGIGGVMFQLVPILRARGIAPEQAAAIQGALGLAIILGRAGAGFLMDRLFAPYVAGVIILFPMTGAAMLAGGASGNQALLAAVFLGFAAGAELDVLAYLVTRYFGTRGYSENYGWGYAAWTLGAGTAPLLTAYSFDRLGTHAPVLWAYAGCFALSALLVARLGPYPKLLVASASDVSDEPSATAGEPLSPRL